MHQIIFSKDICMDMYFSDMCVRALAHVHRRMHTDTSSFWRPVYLHIQTELNVLSITLNRS